MFNPRLQLRQEVFEALTLNHQQRITPLRIQGADGNVQFIKVIRQLIFHRKGQGLNAGAAPARPGLGQQPAAHFHRQNQLHIVPAQSLGGLVQ